MTSVASGKVGPANDESEAKLPRYCQRADPLRQAVARQRAQSAREH